MTHVQSGISLWASCITNILIRSLYISFDWVVSNLHLRMFLLWCSRRPSSECICIKLLCFLLHYSLQLIEICFVFCFSYTAVDRQPVKTSVIRRPILLALEDVDGTPSFLEKALQFIEEHGGYFFSLFLLRSSLFRSTALNMNLFCGTDVLLALFSIFNLMLIAI